MLVLPLPWLAAGDPTAVWIFLALVGLVFAGAFLWDYLSDEASHRRTMRKTPRRSLDHPDSRETGRFVGTVRELDPTLIAPLTGRRCVVYRATLLQKVGKRLRTVVREEQGVPFLLEDGASSVRVDPKGAFLLLDEHLRTSSGFWQGEPDARAAAFLVRHDVDNGGLFLRPSCTCRSSPPSARPSTPAAVRPPQDGAPRP
jgi:hypothetical protein